MKIYIPIFFLVLTLLFTGCNHFTSPARKHTLEDKEQYWLDYDASRRGAFFFKDGASIKTCAEPSPDVANKLTEQLEASATYQGVTAAGKGDFSQDVVKLAERTQMIMFLRETLFRLCELSLNYEIPPQEYIKLYKEVLATSLNMTKADVTKAEARKVQAEANKTKAMTEQFEIKKNTRKLLEELEKNKKIK
jgi:type III secretion system FlhB-like substrate exporter